MKTPTRKMKTMSTRPRPIFVVAISAFVCLASLASRAASVLAEDKPKPYALIFGTAYGPDDRPIYGAKVIIHPDGKKHPTWELYSDHRGEFAQRVPPGPGDYIATGTVEVIPVENGKPQKSRKKRLSGEAKVHVAGQEEHDFSLHLQ